MKRWSSLVALAVALLCGSAFAQQYELTCGVGTSVLYSTFNPTTQRYRAWLCVDSNGFVTSPVFAASTNGITGGVLNFVPLFGSSTTITGPSHIFDSGTLLTFTENANFQGAMTAQNGLSSNTTLSATNSINGGSGYFIAGLTYGNIYDAFTIGCVNVSPGCSGGTDGGRKISSIINATNCGSVAGPCCPSASGAFPLGLNVGCIIDARNPQVTADMVWQINPLHGPNKNVVLLLGMHTYVACVPIVSGQSGYQLWGMDATAQIPGGSRIRPGAVADGCAGTFPNGASQLVFTWQHGLYPSGTYAALYNDCGDPSTDSPTGSTADCFGGQIRDVQFDAAATDANPVTVQPAASFLFYSAATEERGGLFDVSFKNCIIACAFFDRNNQIGPPSPGGSGPVHFDVKDVVMTERTDLAGDLITDGLVMEGNTTFISFAGGTCTETTNPVASGTPQAYITFNAGNPNGAATVTNGGNCSVVPTTCTLNAPGTHPSPATCAFTLTGGTTTPVLTVTITCTGACATNSDYPSAAVPGGGPFIQRMTITGGGATSRFRNAIAIEGTRDVLIEHIHTERVGNPGVNPGSGGDTVKMGFGNAPYSGGFFSAINTTSGTGGCLHFGPGALSSDYAAADITREISAGCVIVDDNVINPLTNTAYSLNTTDTPSHKRVPFYAGGGAGLVQSKVNTIFPCNAVGTAASPSVASCGSASEGVVTCNAAASGATCTVNTTAVTAVSQITLQVVTDETVHTGRTCNSAAITTLLGGTYVSGRATGVSFTITLPAFVTNDACIDFQIHN